jgi:hypothetical protein
MSLKQKYTWHDFLKEHPEHRQKGTKRTSPEGKKAFEAAYKARAKEYLEGLQKRYDREIKKAETRRAEFTARVKELCKAKKFPKARIAQEKVGRRDAAIAQLGRQKERAAAARKAV